MSKQNLKLKKIEKKNKRKYRKLKTTQFYCVTNFLNSKINQSGFLLHPFYNGKQLISNVIHTYKIQKKKKTHTQKNDPNYQMKAV